MMEDSAGEEECTRGCRSVHAQARGWLHDSGGERERETRREEPRQSVVVDRRERQARLCSGADSGRSAVFDHEEEDVRKGEVVDGGVAKAEQRRVRPEQEGTRCETLATSYEVRQWNCFSDSISWVPWFSLSSLVCLKSKTLHSLTATTPPPRPSAHTGRCTAERCGHHHSERECTLYSSRDRQGTDREWMGGRSRAGVEEQGGVGVPPLHVLLPSCSPLIHTHCCSQPAHTHSIIVMLSMTLQHRLR